MADDNDIFRGSESFEEFTSKMMVQATQRGFTDIEAWFSKVSMENAYGSRTAIFQDVLYGINRRMRGDNVPANTDMQGLTFLTRPDLNLTYDNISQVRTMTHLLTKDPLSFQRAIRVLLDTTISVEAVDQKVLTPLVDEKLPYIALLTNSIVSCSGWPDLQLNTYVSPEGMAKESFIMNDKIAELYEHYTLTLSFQNMKGDPISLMFLIWLTYMGAVFSEKMVPYPKHLIDNTLDYCTRIYRFVMDATGTKVQKWASCGAGFPTSLNIGQSFNFNRDTPYSSDLDQIQIPFSCVGAIYNDPITLDEFNMTTCALNEELRLSVEGSSNTYVPIPRAETKLFNYHGYPIVDLDTNELLWYIHSELLEDYRRGTTDGVQ